MLGRVSIKDSLDLSLTHQYHPVVELVKNIAGCFNTLLVSKLEQHTLIKQLMKFVQL